ncbi:hypothetical protein AAW51_4098 [Caldimonas brevitalea]|uniref:Uncharacterized protein n=1 Tax=Caldimonas brevitalea TaxID=413882 RepID=A0A0G3BMY0_9BURK|nr:hypothetical protein AAW51_4098 [Caldimonas brevitalea]
MAVMSTRMHLAGGFTDMRKLVQLLNRERIHICSQRDAAIRRSLTDHSDNSGAAYTAMNLQAPAFKALRDDVSSPVLVKSQFWMSVKITPETDVFVGTADQAFDHLHKLFLLVAQMVNS